MPDNPLPDITLADLEREERSFARPRAAKLVAETRVSSLLLIPAAGLPCPGMKITFSPAAPAEVYVFAAAMLRDPGAAAFTDAGLFDGEPSWQYWAGRSGTALAGVLGTDVRAPGWHWRDGAAGEPVWAAEVSFGTFPGFRRQGTGLAMLRAAPRLAGAAVLLAQVQAGSEAAEGLLRKAGFSLTGRVNCGKPVWQLTARSRLLKSRVHRHRGSG